MIKVNVGDYVETIDGKVGYIIELIGNYKFVWKCVDIIYEQMIPNDVKVIAEYYTRIGSHDFTVKVKENTIEPIKIEPEYKEMKCMVANIQARDAYDTAIRFEPKMEKIICGIKEISNVELYKKINEIIAYINKEEK